MSTNANATVALMRELLKAGKNKKKSTWDKKELPSKQQMKKLVNNLKG